MFPLPVQYFYHYFFKNLVLQCHLQVRSKQEQQLKVRNFLPPQSAEPEMFLVGREGYDGAGGGIIYGPDGRAMYPDGTYVDEVEGWSSMSQIKCFSQKCHRCFKGMCA